MKLSGFKALALTLLFTMASGFNAANAALVTHNGYTLDEDTDIVTGGGLEWLQWDVTNGLSVNSALAANGIFGGADYGNGWTLATNEQMVALYTAFTFNSNTTGTVALTQLAYTEFTDTTVMDKFIEVMGTTYTIEGSFYGSGVDAYRLSRAVFGTGPSVGSHLAAHIESDSFLTPATGTPFTIDNRALMYTTRSATSDNAQRGVGVALVRQIDVPEPSTVAILAMGLLGLGLRRKLRV